MEDPAEIAELVNVNLRKEWEADMAEHADQQDRDWLEKLERRCWRLEKVNLATVKLNGRIMDYADSRTGYVFTRELEKRVRALRDGVERFGAVIWPLVVRGEDGLLVDGYCRYHVLIGMNVTEAYAYVGDPREPI